MFLRLFKFFYCSYVAAPSVLYHTRLPILLLISLPQRWFDVAAVRSLFLYCCSTLFNVP